MRVLVANASAALTIGFCCVLGMPTAPAALYAQEGSQDATARESTNVPRYVADLIVHIEAFKSHRGRSSREDGAGIVVGMDSEHVYVATAKHVVTLIQDPSLLADSLRVEFESERKFVSATVDTMSADVDLAVIKIRRDEAEAAGFRPVLDRLGDSGKLRPGAEVSPVGCPGSDCWRAPSPADRVLSSNAIETLFQTSFVRGGSSGGGLFNGWWEVVGLVFRVEPPGAYALPMDFVVQQLQSWNVPVTLQKPSIPRAGYGTTVGVALLLPATGGVFPDGRVPSGRVALTRALRPGVDVHISGLRLAPKQVGSSCPPTITTGSTTKVLSFRDRLPCEAVVHALMAGVGGRIEVGRLAVRPFGELGMGRVRGRYDLGGVYQFETLTYLPNLAAVEQTGFGVGAGLAVDFVVFPRTILQGLAGYWKFQDPFEGAELPSEYDPNMPQVFVGFGLRMGL